MISYYQKRIDEACTLAEDEAARANFTAAIFKLTDALREAQHCISELAQKADAA